MPLPSWRWPGCPHCSGGAAVGGLVSSITISIYRPPGQQGMVWEGESRLFWAPTFRGTLRRGCFSFPCQQIPFVQRSVPSVTPCGVQVSLLRPTKLRLSGVSAPWGCESLEIAFAGVCHFAYILLLFFRRVEFLLNLQFSFKDPKGWVFCPLVTLGNKCGVG